MSTRKPRAHLYVDGGGMVTGTHDVHLARRLLVREVLDGNPDNPDLSEYSRRDIAETSAYFRPQDARLETGRVVPIPPSADDPEYIWLWRAGYELGKPGVTRAVVWTP